MQWFGDGFHKRGRSGLEFSPAPALDSAVRSANPVKNAASFSCTLAFVPKQVVAVTSSRAQSQIASSALNSGL